MLNLNVIDGNAVGRYLHATKLKTAFRNADGHITNSLFGFIGMLIDLKKKANPGDKNVVLWDGHADFRYEMYPEYKGNRKARNEEQEKLYEEYKWITPYTRSAISALGIPQFLNLKLEADDLASIIVNTPQPQDISISLITGDKDWLQLVRKNVVWCDIRNERRAVGEYNFKAVTELATPELFLQKKCLTGDSSDNVSGVGGIGEKRAIALLNEWGSVDNFFANFDKYEGKKKSWEERLFSEEGREIYYRNRKLMNLIDAPAEDKNYRKVMKRNLDLDTFFGICAEMNFSTYLSKAEEIKELFNE